VSPGARVGICADVGSTFTKVAAVDLDTGELLGRATHPTTVATDVLDGLDAAVAEVSGLIGVRVNDISTTDVCSSAGGGLRLAVVGYEQLVTAQAGHRVGLSAGARVVHVGAGPLDATGVDELRAARPDVVLLVGGTDGGDAAVLTHNARRLAAARLRVPVVAAGNADARDEVVAALAGRGTPVVPAANVLPRIGTLNPYPARAAIREVFLRHVIGGKRLSRGRRFASLVRGATPDVVLTAVELFAADLSAGGDLVVVDIGGATTDVYSVLSPDPAQSPSMAEVAGTLWHSRTVEADLGMRWSAPGVVEAAVAERLVAAERARELATAAALRAGDPAFLPGTDADRLVDERLASLAAVVALRRHARDDRVSGGSGRDATRGPVKDLRRVALIIGSGGVLRHAAEPDAVAALSAVLTDHAGGWAPPRAAAVTVDADYVLAPAGLLAAREPQIAAHLLRTHLLGDRMVTRGHRQPTLT
jgi:uncharacterized protein (TIGR01319 family)